MNIGTRLYSMATPLIDTHSHIFSAVEKLHRSVGEITGLCVILATREEEWPIVELFAHQYPCTFIPAFGVHPWKAHLVSHGWECRLEEILKRNPRGLVGEIGLDFVSKTPETNAIEKDQQRDVFARQFDIAARLRRPVSIHLVKAFGAFQTLVNETKVKHRLFPPSISLHSYSGSPEFASEMLKAIPTELYFGFSYALSQRIGKTTSVLQMLAPDRILIETDRSEFDKAEQLQSELQLMAAQVAKHTGSAFINAQLNANARAWMAIEVQD